MENGYACLQYGMWSLRQNWVRNIAVSVMALVDFEFIQEAVSLARRWGDPPSQLGVPSRVLKLWFNNFPSRRKSASVGVVTHSFFCNGHEHTKTWVLKDHLREDDVHWLSHVLALCLCALLGGCLFHWGVKQKPAWIRRDRSRSDFWSSIRAQLPLGIEDLSR
eukprot:440420-Amphidinium_carterae.4